jgi:CO/xanthine dehydrogenase Mo-binding subunit
MTEGWLGSSVPRPDGPGKALGQAEFVDDVVLPGMVHARILRSPHPAARIVSIAVDEALAHPGVVGVFTGGDLGQVGVPLSKDSDPTERDRVRRYGMNIQDETVLAVDEVRFVGDEVAAVVAETPEAAAAALRLVRVAYEEIPPVTDPLRATDPDERRVHADRDSNVAVQFHIDRGDVDRAFAEADLVVSGTFTTPLQHQGYLDHYGVVADRRGDRLTLWAPVQDPFLLRDAVADVTGLPAGSVRVIQPTIGGSYGGKLRHQKLPYIAAFLTSRLGRPVKLVNTRAEEFSAGRPRIAATLDMALAFASDGRLLGKRTTIVGDNGAYTSYATGPFVVMTMRADNQYRLHDIRTDSTLVYTNSIPSGSFRGYGNIQHIFPLESLMDEAAHRLGIHPLELRLRNAVHAGDVTAHDWVIQTDGLRECLEAVRAASADWGADGHPHRGIGYAAAIHSSSNRTLPFDGATCRLTLNSDGTITLATGEPDLGQGSAMAFAQLAATVLELPLSCFSVATVDTDLSPFGLGPSSDRSTTSGGQAVVGAARRLVEVMLDAVEEVTGRPRDSLRYARGVVESSDGGAPMSLPELAAAAMWRRGGRPISTEFTFDHPHTVQRDPDTLRGNSHPTHAFAAAAVEVEVDVDTGEVQLLRMVSAHDLGRAINPAAAEGQVEGAVAHGLGFALHETYLDEAGLPVRTLLEYGQVRSTQMPPLDVILVETDDPKGPLGAKGVGQPGSLLPGPAIANAIADAVGVRVRDLPLTADRILTAIHDRGDDRS